MEAKTSTYRIVWRNGHECIVTASYCGGAISEAYRLHYQPESCVVGVFPENR